MPYICVDLDLDQQLVHLSAALPTWHFITIETTQHMPNLCQLSHMLTS
jgi:hypothetical protein